MDQSYSSDANSLSATQDISYPLWNTKFHYGVHNSPPLIRNPSQIHPLYTFLTYFSKIHSTMSSHIRRSLCSDVFPSSFLIKILYEIIISSMRAKCHAHLILLYLATLIIREQLFLLLQRLLKVQNEQKFVIS
jgi:hypothetical protein